MIEFRWTLWPSKWFCCTYQFLIPISRSGWLKCAEVSCITRTLTANDITSSSIWTSFNKRSLWHCLLDFVANTRNCQTVHHSTNLHINSGLRLVCTVNCNTLILLWLLLVVVNTFVAIPTTLCLLCDDHSWDKHYIRCLQIKLRTKIAPRWVISRQQALHTL